MKEYETVFLDWSNTLSVSKFWGHWENEENKYHQLFPLVENFLFVENRHLLEPWMRGQYTTEQIVEFISAETKINYELLLKQLIESCQKMEFVSPQVENLVLCLKEQGLKVVVATDNMDCFSRWTVPALGLNWLFDGVLNSYDLKVLKRDKDERGRSLFFYHYFQTHGINPENTVLVDDSGNNGEAMKSFGINFLRVQSPAGIIPALLALSNSSNCSNNIWKF